MGEENLLWILTVLTRRTSVFSNTNRKVYCGATRHFEKYLEGPGDEVVQLLKFLLTPTKF